VAVGISPAAVAGLLVVSIVVVAWIFKTGRRLKT
jgi:hypothetical protein